MHNLSPRRHRLRVRRSWHSWAAMKSWTYSLPSLILDCAAPSLGSRPSTMTWKNRKLRGWRTNRLTEGSIALDHVAHPSEPSVQSVFRLYAKTQAVNSVQRSIRFDVIDVHLLFLIGLSSLLGLKSLLNFQFRNPSIAIHRTMSCLQLVNRSAHSKLSLLCNVTHHRQIRDSNDSCFVSTSVNNSSSQGLAQSSYYTPTSVISAVKMTFLSPLRSAALTVSELKMIHLELGQATAIELKIFLQEARKWDQDYVEMIDQICRSCTCSLASQTLPRLVC